MALKFYLQYFVAYPVIVASHTSFAKLEQTVEASVWKHEETLGSWLPLKSATQPSGNLM